MFTIRSSRVYWWAALLSVGAGPLCLGSALAQAPGNRGGLLTQASILTLTSNPTRTAPVKRGKWILEQLLGMIALAFEVVIRADLGEPWRVFRRHGDAIRDRANIGDVK